MTTNLNCNNKKYHYCYSVFDKESLMFYIGCRSSNVPPEEDLGKKYFTSSKIVKPLFKSNPERFTTCYVIHSTREQAIEHEVFLHELFDVGVNPIFYNKCKQTSTGFDSSGVSPNEETRKIQSEVNKGNQHSKGTTHNRNRKHYYNPVTGERRSFKPDDVVPDGFVPGRNTPTSHNRGRKWYHNPDTGESCMLKPDDVVPDNFIEGQCAEHKEKNSFGNRGKHKGRRWFHNPITNIRTTLLPHDPIPKGFIQGFGI